MFQSGPDTAVHNTVPDNTLATTGLKPGMEDKVTYDEEKFDLVYDLNI